MLWVMILLAAPPDLVKVAREIHHDFNDISFAYEGEWGEHDGSRWLRPESMQQMIGRAAFHADGVWTVSVERPQKKGGVSIEQHSFLRNQKEIIINRDPNPRDVPSQQIRTAYAMRAHSILESPLAVFGAAYIGILRDPDLERLEDQGEEVVDGHRCRVLFHRHSPFTQERLWIDIERSAHVIQWESLRGGKRAVLVHDIELAQTPDANGKQVWVPITGIRDYFGREEKGQDPRPKIIFSERATARMVYRILTPTMIINKGRRKEELVLKLDRGPNAFIIEPDKMLQRAPPPKEERSRPSSKPTTAMVKGTFDEAEKQAAELLAMVRTSPPMDSTPYWIAGGAVVVAIGAFWLRRRAG